VDWGAPTTSGLKEAFESSGLGSREIVLLVGALGEVERVVGEAKDKIQQEEVDEFEDAEQRVRI
jgi:hypothetical protein